MESLRHWESSISEGGKWLEGAWSLYKEHDIFLSSPLKKGLVFTSKKLTIKQRMKLVDLLLWGLTKDKIGTKHLFKNSDLLWEISSLGSDHVAHLIKNNNKSPFVL